MYVYTYTHAYIYIHICMYVITRYVYTQRDIYEYYITSGTFSQ